MRKIDYVANEKYNGNVKAALKDILFNGVNQELDQYVDELTGEESLYVYELMKEEVYSMLGGKENFKAETKKEKLLKELSLTTEEVRNAAVNPYKSNLFKGLLKALIVEGGIIALILSGIPLESISFGSSISTGLVAASLAPNLIDYVKFKKLKKIVDSQIDRSPLNEEIKNKGGR